MRLAVVLILLVTRARHGFVVLQEAEFARKSASRSYEQGKATYLDVLDSQRTLLLTRTEYADILLTYREAWTALERASGGGLER